MVQVCLECGDGAMLLTSAVIRPFYFDYGCALNAIVSSAIALLYFKST